MANHTCVRIALPAPAAQSQWPWGCDALQSIFCSQLAQGVHLHQPWAPRALPQAAVSVEQHSAATPPLSWTAGQPLGTVQQWSWAALLPPQPECFSTSPGPHSNQVIGERGSNVSGFGVTPGRELQHCFPQGRAVVGLEPCWAAESPQLPTLQTEPEENGFQQFHSSQRYWWMLL